MRPSEIKPVEFFDDRFYKVLIPGADTIPPTPPQIDYYVSVTTALNAINKPFIARWRGDLGNAEADRRLDLAAVSGSRVHHASKLMREGGVVFYNHPFSPQFSDDQIKELAGAKPFIVIHDQNEYWSIYKYSLWLQKVKPTLLYSELTVWDNALKCAGTLDYLDFIPAGSYEIAGAKPLKLEAGLYVVDLKSGRFADDLYDEQVAAYLKMVFALIAAGQISIPETPNNPPSCLEFKGALIVHTQATTKKGIEGLQTYFLGMNEVDKKWESFQRILALWKDKFGDTKPKVFEMPGMITL